MPVNLSDLTSLERTYLGVVAVGLPPSRLIGDPWLRLDYLSAVAQAYMEQKPATAYLIAEGPEPQPDFLRALREAVYRLEERDIIGTSPPSVFFAFEAPAPKAANLERIDPNAPPTIFDNFLAQQCMNLLLSNPKVYRFLMEKYAESSEQWQRLLDQGYGEGSHI